MFISGLDTAAPSTRWTQTQAALNEQAPGGYWRMASFGAGFSCHGALLAID